MTIGIVVHDFQAKLAESNTLSDEDSWIGFYERVWPGQIVCSVRIDKDSVFQRWGVDREIKLVTGQQFTVDEKKRTKDYGDMLIEEWSQFYGERDTRNKVGWTRDRAKRCDFVAWAVVPSGKCWLIPFDLLRRTTHAYLGDWKKAAGTRYPSISQNRNYQTVNCPVSWDRLWMDMRRVSEKAFSGEVKLPVPFVAKDQMVFEFGR